MSLLIWSIFYNLQINSIKHQLLVRPLWCVSSLQIFPLPISDLNGNYNNIMKMIKKWIGRERERDLELEYSKSLPVAEKMIRATSASQRTESSSAFLKIPLRLLEKVTCLAVALSIFLIWIFSLAISLRLLASCYCCDLPEKE